MSIVLQHTTSGIAGLLRGQIEDQGSYLLEDDNLPLPHDHLVDSYTQANAARGIFMDHVAQICVQEM